MAGRGESKASERRIDAAETQRQALELRKAGIDYRTIAARLGYSGPSGAHKAVMTALKNITREPAEELRTLELERLDRLFVQHYQQALAGDQKATDRCLRIMERRAKLLGLDAPEQLDVGGGMTREYVIVREGR